jgi:hypothetical protein
MKLKETMEDCKSNGCRRALHIALASHNKLVEQDIINKTEEIIGYIQFNFQLDYGKIFKQVAMISLLLNQNHPFGQFAMSFNYQFFKALCRCRYDHIEKLVTSPLHKLYPEIFLNHRLENEREMMASRVEHAITLVCNAIYCNTEDPFKDISLSSTKVCKKSTCSKYTIKYDYHKGCVHYCLNDEKMFAVSIKEVAECIARCPSYPINPLTGKTMTSTETKFLHNKLYMEISCIQYFLTNVEYNECGYGAVKKLIKSG